MAKGKILILTGKSASGKDTTLNQLVVEHSFNRAILWTSRPIRPNEQNNREYHFCTHEEFMHLISREKLIEYRTYNTLVNNKSETWYYGLDKTEIDLSKGDYCVIMDLEGAESLINEYGEENCFVVYLNVSAAIREYRCMDRKDYDEYEWNRRVKADSIAFSLDKHNRIVDYTCYASLKSVDYIVNEILSAFIGWRTMMELTEKWKRRTRQ